MRQQPQYDYPAMAQAARQLAANSNGLRKRMNLDLAEYYEGLAEKKKPEGDGHLRASEQAVGADCESTKAGEA